MYGEMPTHYSPGDRGSSEGGGPVQMPRQEHGHGDVLIEESEEPVEVFDAMEAFSRITVGNRTQLPPYPTLQSPVGTAASPAAGILRLNGVHVEEEAGANACAYSSSFNIICFYRFLCLSDSGGLIPHHLWCSLQHLPS
jgi:hypothetical protein